MSDTKNIPDVLHDVYELLDAIEKMVSDMKNAYEYLAEGKTLKDDDCMMAYIEGRISMGEGVLQEISHNMALMVEAFNIIEDNLGGDDG